MASRLDGGYNTYEIEGRVSLTDVTTQYFRGFSTRCHIALVGRA